MGVAPGLLIALFIVVAGMLIWLGWRAARKRREAFFRLSVRLGLRYSIQDPFHTTDLPFTLFGKGDRRGAENVLWGEAAGMRVRLFDYWFQVHHHNPNGPDTTSTSRFSCALGELDADCPHLVIEPEGFFSRLADHLGFRDVEFESEEFNRAFQVTSDDRRFAFAFVDARMMGWLMKEGGVARYEVHGPLILCYTDRVRPEEYENLLEVLRRFHAHVPAVVASLYPKGVGA